MNRFRDRAAGRSAERKYKTLSKAWRDRMFGRRFTLYFLTIWIALFVLVEKLHLPSTWALYAGFAFGAAAAAWVLLPDAVMPNQIFKWQLGAWGEQKTAGELKRLRRDGWVVRHDAAWGERANHDHVAVGPAVYLLNSKNIPASRVYVDGDTVRVTQVDDPNDSYTPERWIPGVEWEARALQKKLRTELGLAVHVYPVLVLWGEFPQRQTYVGDVSIVDGLHLVEWLKSRPTDLVNTDKRRAVPSGSPRCRKPAKAQRHNRYAWDEEQRSSLALPTSA